MQLGSCSGILVTGMGAEQASYAGPHDPEGRPHGVGRMTYEEGVLFEGCFQHGTRCVLVPGCSCLQQPVAHVLVPAAARAQCRAPPTHSNSLPHREGTGKLTYPNGDTLEGAWHKDEVQGQARYTNADGSWMAAHYVDGELHGEYAEHDEEGELMKEGTFCHGQPTGAPGSSRRMSLATSQGACWWPGFCSIGVPLAGHHPSAIFQQSLQQSLLVCRDGHLALLRRRPAAS